MGVKVAKFGGSSVADAIQLSKVKNIIQADADRRYVVVSAPGKRFSEDNKMTDLLYLCKTHIEHNVPYDQVFQVICDRFRAMEMNLGVDVNLESEFIEIRKKLEAGASADYIASRGEYLSALLTAAYLEYDFVDSAGLVQFDKKGRFLDEETNEALSKALAEHKKAVIPGFFGTYPDGSIKTFSRGGSDITGSLIARAVKADVYENWTDVPGFLVADPRIVKNPEPIKMVSYQELRELSYMGASVLHEDAVYPVREANIPINIRNTNDPQHPGTIILSEPNHSSDRIVTGIAGSKDFSVIAISKNMMASERGFIRRILSILEDYDVPVEHLPSGIDTISIVVSNKKLNHALDEILEEIERKVQPDKIDVFNNMALIATVGAGMTNRLGVSATLFTALYEAKVNIRMIDQGSSEINIIVGVENKDFETAIKAIYNALVKERA
ncbi:aspartate kinase [Sinanaerobacter sp. ZZT-01]|uniref:aspartate kinase n=1 Tax=Sinanaerobacter sp. ZZT-01 TaxID=3111540 RepID=UPI002D769196|nr:aspartate kinase [Sinanaerobacter sp. ZZT-01]WRR94518.1 aspartate kinase [Sinanaerobacter sp. ZZT-01]